MAHYLNDRFNASFGALADATRRGVLEQLERGDASITTLAETFDMTLTGMKKHVSVLELAGLVSTRKRGRVRTCSLGPRALTQEIAWLEGHRQRWAVRFDALDALAQDLEKKEGTDERGS